MWPSLGFRVNTALSHRFSPSLWVNSLLPPHGGAPAAQQHWGASSENGEERIAAFPATCATFSLLHREDAVAPKTPTWTRSRPADTISKTSTLSSIVGSRDRPYGASPPSYTASVLTAAGSYQGPPRAGPHPPATNGAPWHPPQPVAPPGGPPPSSLARAGAVPVMVPAQSRAGSLV